MLNKLINTLLFLLSVFALVTPSAFGQSNPPSSTCTTGMLFLDTGSRGLWVCNYTNNWFYWPISPLTFTLMNQPNGVLGLDANGNIPAKYLAGVTGNSNASAAFSTLIGGTNTNSQMIIGAGSSLSPSNGGVITANAYSGASLTVPGSVTATGSILESAATKGIQVGMGPLADSPRLWFGNGVASQNWEIDNYVGGNMRFFTPAGIAAQLTPAGSLIIPPTGNINTQLIVTNGINLALPTTPPSAVGQVLTATSTSGSGATAWTTVTSGNATPSGAANLIVATPNGASGTSALRALVAADIPVITSAKISDFNSAVALAAPVLTVNGVSPVSGNVSIPSSAAPSVTDVVGSNGTILTQAKFNSGATGSLSRSFTSKVSDIRSVLDFSGVLGNGTNDDTAGVQAAVNAASNSGFCLYFPGGYTYKFHNVNVTNSTCAKGDGGGIWKGRTVVDLSGGTTAFQSAVDQSGNYLTDIDLEGFYFVNGVNPIDLSAAFNLKLSDITCNSFSGACINLVTFERGQVSKINCFTQSKPAIACVSAGSYNTSVFASSYVLPVLQFVDRATIDYVVALPGPAGDTLSYLIYSYAGWDGNSQAGSSFNETYVTNTTIFGSAGTVGQCTVACYAFGQMQHDTLDTFSVDGIGTPSAPTPVVFLAHGAVTNLKIAHFNPGSTLNYYLRGMEFDTDNNHTEVAGSDFGAPGNYTIQHGLYQVANQTVTALCTGCVGEYYNTSGNSQWRDHWQFLNSSMSTNGTPGIILQEVTGNGFTLDCMADTTAATPFTGNCLRLYGTTGPAGSGNTMDYLRAGPNGLSLGLGFVGKPGVKIYDDGTLTNNYGLGVNSGEFQLFAGGSSFNPHYTWNYNGFQTNSTLNRMMYLDTNGLVLSSGVISAPLFTPASSSASCSAGQFADDATYHYVCVAANTWKRSSTMSSF